MTDWDDSGPRRGKDEPLLLFKRIAKREKQKANPKKKEKAKPKRKEKRAHSPDWVYSDPKRTRDQEVPIGEDEYAMEEESFGLGSCETSCSGWRPPQEEPEAMEEIPMGASFYGFVMSLDADEHPEEPHTFVRMSLLSEEWFDARNALSREEFDKIHPFVESVEISFWTPGRCYDPADAGTPFSIRIWGAKVEERRWYRVMVADQPSGGAIEVTAHVEGPEGTGDPLTAWLTYVSGAGSAEERLFEIFSVRPEDDSGEHAASINQVVSYIGVFDIGQGGCNALFGGNGLPFLFYDFGRAKQDMHASRRDPINVCLHGDPTVVLSHWDDDHCLLVRSQPAVIELPWLLPPGHVTISERNWTRTLEHRRIWTHARRAFEEFSWGFILKGHAPGININEKCLVLLVRVQDDSDAPPPGQRRALDDDGRRPQLFPRERYVLMTGDTMFQNIASCRARDLDGLLVGLNASHHGARAHLEEEFIPRPAPPLNGMPPMVTFSFGVDPATGVHGYSRGGSHGHPFPEAVLAYKRRGWHYALQTAGSIDVDFIRSDGASCIVRHVNHRRPDGSNVRIENAGAYDYNGAIGEIDDDHYSIAVAPPAVTAIVAAAVASVAVQILDNIAGALFVHHPGHGLGPANNVNIANGGVYGAANAPIQVCGGDYYSIAGSQGVTQLVTATSNGDPVRLYDAPANSSLVVHPGHGLSGGTVTIAGTGAVYDGAQAITVVDENHYLIPVTAPPLGAPRVLAGRSGIGVKVYGIAAGESLIRETGHGRANGANVTLRRWRGTALPGMPATVSTALADPDHYIINVAGAANRVRSDLRASPYARWMSIVMGWRPLGAPTGAGLQAIQQADAAYIAAAAAANEWGRRSLAASLVADAAIARLGRAAPTVANVCDDAAAVLVNAVFINLLTPATTPATMAAMTAAMENGIAAGRNAATAATAKNAIVAVADSIHSLFRSASAEVDRLGRALVAVSTANNHFAAPQAALCGGGFVQRPPQVAPNLDPVIHGGHPPDSTVSAFMAGNGTAFAGEAVTLINIAAGACLVTMPGHNIHVADVVITGAIAAIDGRRAVTVVDGDHFTIPVTNNAPAAYPMARVGIELDLLEFPDNNALVRHAGHGAGGPGPLTILNAAVAAYDGNWNITAVVDANHYLIDRTAGAVGATAAQVGMANVLIFERTALVTLAYCVGHGLATNDKVRISGSPAAHHDGEQSVTRVSPVLLTIPTVSVGTAITQIVASRPALVLDRAANTSIIRHPNHGLQNGVQVTGANAANATYTAVVAAQYNAAMVITTIDANYYAVPPFVNATIIDAAITVNGERHDPPVIAALAGVARPGAMGALVANVCLGGGCRFQALQRT
jgi:hypothetical protein